MGSKKGEAHKYRTKEFKIKVVKEVLNGRSPAAIAKEHEINKGLLRKWIAQYTEGGEAALEPKRRPGNPLSKYSRRKELTELEQLQYKLAKAEVEIARLKKACELERRCGKPRK